MVTTKIEKIESGHLAAYLSPKDTQEEINTDICSIKLPTLDEIRTAFKKSGITPVKHRYFSGTCADGTKYGCMLTALFLANNDYDGPENRLYEEVVEWADLKYGRDFVGYMMMGWDDMSATKFITPQLQLALDLGSNAAKMMGVTK